MVDLAFECLDIAPERYAAGPTLLFKLRVTDKSGGRIHAISLRCQIRIEPARRSYTEGEAALLEDLFGARSRWGDTLKAMQFANAAVMVPSFDGTVDVDVSVPVSYDMEVATGKYLHALGSGGPDDVTAEPISFVLFFSGTVFGKGDNGFWVEQVPWHAEAAYRMPSSVWRDVMDIYFPDSGWLCLRRETLDTLIRFKSDRGLATFDDVMKALIGEVVVPAQSDGVAS
jgi:hypothetical protein